MIGLRTELKNGVRERIARTSLLLLWKIGLESTLFFLTQDFGLQFRLVELCSKGHTQWVDRHVDARKTPHTLNFVQKMGNNAQSQD